MNDKRPEMPIRTSKSLHTNDVLERYEKQAKQGLQT